MDDPAAKKPGREGGTAGLGASAPAKGESSSGDFPRPEKKQPPSESAGIPGETNTLNDDVTFGDAPATPAKARHSAIFPKRNQFAPGHVFGGRYEILQV